VREKFSAVGKKGKEKGTAAKAKDKVPTGNTFDG
jgi:hypothetical protein